VTKTFWFSPTNQAQQRAALVKELQSRGFEDSIPRVGVEDIIYAASVSDVDQVCDEIGVPEGGTLKH
jgi:hypothetical protein